MGLARSTFYDATPASLDTDGVLARIGAICEEFECYGYRRIGAALRQQGVVVNGKKLRRWPCHANDSASGYRLRWRMTISFARHQFPRDHPARRLALCALHAQLS
jgi:HTH-like domain